MRNHHWLLKSSSEIRETYIKLCGCFVVNSWNILLHSLFWAHTEGSKRNTGSFSRSNSLSIAWDVDTYKLKVIPTDTQASEACFTAKMRMSILNALDCGCGDEII